MEAFFAGFSEELAKLAMQPPSGPAKVPGVPSVPKSPTPAPAPAKNNFGEIRSLLNQRSILQRKRAQIKQRRLQLKQKRLRLYGE